MAKGGKEGSRARLGNAVREILRTLNPQTFSQLEKDYKLPSGIFSSIMAGEYSVITGNETVNILSRKFEIDTDDIIQCPLVLPQEVEARWLRAADNAKFMSVEGNEDLHSPPDEQQKTEAEVLMENRRAYFYLVLTAMKDF